jgi:hypothetical protein
MVRLDPAEPLMTTLPGTDQRAWCTAIGFSTASTRGGVNAVARSRSAGARAVAGWGQVNSMPSCGLRAGDLLDGAHEVRARRYGVPAVVGQAAHGQRGQRS